MPRLLWNTPSAAPNTRSLLNWLPRGHGLSDQVWAARHRFMQWVLWLHVPLLAVVGLVSGEDTSHVLSELGLIAGLAVLSRLSATRTMQAIWVSLGLLSSSALLVHFTGGLIESHFHFFVVLPLVALYQDWRPFLAGLGFVVVHHGVMGRLSPESVYNHPAALANPVLWAFIHAGFVLGLVAVLVFHWKFAERSESALRTSEERFRSSFEEAPIGMCLSGLDGQFLQVNRALCQMLGRGLDELLSGSWADVTHPDDVEVSLRAAQRLLDGHASSVSMEKRYLRRDGSELWGRVGLSLVSDRYGRPLHFIAQIEDITERRRDRERLESLVRSKDEFVASVSHELRTPLTAVVGISHMLRDETLSHAEHAELIEMLADQSSEVSNIVEDLLVAARSEIGTISVAPEVIDLSEQARMALGTLGSEARLRVRVGEESPLAWGDSSRVRQILRNLLSNALRYGGENVEVRFEAEADRVSVLVCDNGPGIPDEEWERVFEPYHRAHDRSTQPGSVGLGLTISRQLARLMDGDLTYARIGAESRFELSLPVANDRTTDPTTDPEEIVELTGSHPPAPQVVNTSRAAVLSMSTPRRSCS